MHQVKELVDRSGGRQVSYINRAARDIGRCTKSRAECGRGVGRLDIRNADVERRQALLVKVLRYVVLERSGRATPVTTN
jgi:hypothetical protein